MTWLVAGLGNPGPAYADTRHNVGWMCADELVRRANATWKKPLLARAQVAEVRLRDFGLTAVGPLTAVSPNEKLIIAKPLTYMNDSGIAVKKLAAFAKIPADHIIVIHDELDIDFGALRLKLGGGDNGHNGLKSIRAHLGTGDYYRVRIGIGRPPGHLDPVDYVLAKFPKKDAVDVSLNIATAADAVLALITTDLATAQNRFNS
ncbi:MAG: aminoacyl-tRNA hydrolase [Propionibacteriaceae bacterium]|jgi:PTH1 family peptidyl-tRNA hydrolase|nr:aminoacyl-tRNA hydrolase [Propionibacteriaceae bacterium]